MTHYSLKIDVATVAERIEEYIRELSKDTPSGCVLLGLSGGIDSAVLAALAVRALGSDRVHVIYLYDRDSEASSEHKAEQICEWLGLSLQKQDVSPVMRERGIYSPLIMRISAISRWLNQMIQHSYYFLFHETPHKSTLKYGCGEFGSNPLKRLMFNLTIRHLEAGFNARHIYRREVVEVMAKEKGCLLLGAANRSESMVGWFVKGGIDDLPIQPMLGLYKTQVWQLAEYLNLPQRIKRQKPSPDMMKGITDEFAIGMLYTRLDEILDYLDRGMSDDEIRRRGVLAQELRNVKDIHRLSAWKRESEHLLPPVDGGIGSALRR